MEAKLHLYIGGIVEHRLDDTPCHPSHTLTGEGGRVRSSIALTVPPT